MQDTEPTSDDELACWLRLAGTPGVGPKTGARLLERWKTPAALFAAGAGALEAALPPALARALGTFPPELRQAVDAALAWRTEAGNAILPLTHPAYPPALRQIAAPPLLLYAKGRLDLLAKPGVAIVGSRNASAQGMRNARAFGAALSGCGVTIVSGMAAGIDGAAHDGGLEGPGSTVAVLGTGIDRVYPARHQDLARRIAQDGCLLSEYPLGTRPDSSNFPRRNRIISGLSAAVLVVEAAAESGSLITAQFAADQGRDVLAMPGSIHASLSKGCHALIKQGAQLVESVADVLACLPGQLCVPITPQRTLTSDIHMRLLLLLDGGASDAHELAERTGSTPGFVATQLLSMELDGLVERLPGGMFQRVFHDP
ncbi:MAG TPA: DNA-processing protein DprA [Telluria sp.]|nr:DNA-processing protein DprA [Telluria sp.]